MSYVSASEKLTFAFLMELGVDTSSLRLSDLCDVVLLTYIRYSITSSYTPRTLCDVFFGISVA